MEGFAEYLLGDLAAQRFEDFQLAGAGQAAGGHFRVVEVAAGTGVCAVEQLLVGPLVVQQQAQRLAHAHVLEHRAADVEDEALHARGVAVGQLFLDQAAIAHGGYVVGGGPVLRADFQRIVERTGLECFQSDGGVAVGVEGHDVEVVEAAVDRQVLGPVVLDPLVAHRAPGLDLGDLVRAAAQRDFQVAAVELAVFVPVLGQYRQLAENQRQLAVVLVLEGEQHRQRVFGDHFGDVGIVLAVQRRAVLDQGIEGEHHIFGAHRVAVVEACLGAQVEAHPAVVRGLFDLAGHQTVLGERLVLALAHQGVVDAADVLGRHALVDERVEAVEAAEAGLTEGATLGCVRVDVGEVLEVGGVLGWLVVQGERMLRCGQGGKAQAGKQQAAGQPAQSVRWRHWAFSEVLIHQLFSPRV
ncbi:hypothetical protein D3C78_310170 [compost metagenome]